MRNLQCGFSLGAWKADEGSAVGGDDRGPDVGAAGLLPRRERANRILLGIAPVCHAKQRREATLESASHLRSGIELADDLDHSFGAKRLNRLTGFQDILPDRLVSHSDP
jgi:hypothetical protein